jgi:hypothetical protein
MQTTLYYPTNLKEVEKPNQSPSLPHENQILEETAASQTGGSSQTGLVKNHWCSNSVLYQA